MDKLTLDLKKQICEVGRRIWTRQYCAGNEGNHSVRLSDDRFLVTPTGISKGFLTPSDICLVDSSANLIQPNPNNRKPSSEIKIHIAIYQARPDIKAVIHSHPPHATAFAVSGIPIPEAVHPEAEVFLGKVRTARFAIPSTDDLPASLLPLINSDTNTLLMGNHGSVSFSHDLMDAYYKLEILDAYCRLLILTRQLGTINTISPQDMQTLLKVKQKFGMSDLRSSNPQDIGNENHLFFSTLSATPQDLDSLVESIADRVAQKLKQG